jgi:AraC family transcriptional regulator
VDEFCLVPPFILHAIRWGIQTERVVILIRNEYFTKHVSAFVENVLVGDLKRLSELDNVLWLIAQELRRQVRKTESANPFFFASLGEALVCRTLDRYFAQTEVLDDSTRLSPRAQKRVVDYVDAHLKERLSVKQLAKIAALSAHHFSKVFKTSTGLSPMQYVLKLRIEKARTLLSTGQFRIAEVASELGFYDQSHLDRHFRRFFGHSPKSVLKIAFKSS